MNNTPHLEIFLKVINQPSWDWTFIPDRELCIDCPSEDIARHFIRQWFDSIIEFTVSLNCDRALVRYPNCYRPFDLPIRLFREEKKRARPSFNLGLMTTPQTPNLTRFQTNIPGLGETIFPDFFEFLAEEARKGRFWVIKDNLTEKTLFLTDSAKPGLLVAPAHQYIGRNRMGGWRDTMDDYERLQHLLTTEKVAPSFEHNYYRLDNSLEHCQKTYYLIEELWGTQCRASCSEGWELLRPAPDAN
ncbi:MAG: hypothetical protein J7647_05385 [Cyanobacteria bacterium SBLK]|nr:hypothetical protein [Cyanobacteria bacterium SBLK]